MGLAYHIKFQIESVRSSHNDINIIVPIIPNIINHETICEMIMGGIRSGPREPWGIPRSGHRRSQGGPGMIREGTQDVPKVPGGSQKMSQEVPRGAKRSQEVPGRSQEVQKGTEGSQEVPRGPNGSILLRNPMWNEHGGYKVWF